MQEHSNPLRVPVWHRQTSAAITARDHRALRHLRNAVLWALSGMAGAELFQAQALLARIEAGMRFLHAGGDRRRALASLARQHAARRFLRGGRHG